jgi:hypothetical protein
MTPKSLRKRAGRSFRRKLNNIVPQWLTAIADDDAKPRSLWRSLGLLKNSSWTPPRLVHIEKIIAQMEKYYGRKVPRVNGVPFLWLKRHEVRSFNWKSLYQIMGDRLERLDDWCDEEEDHLEESSETLLLEYIHQYLAYSGKDRFFGLPMTLWLNHPLCFAVAHLVHGRKMRTGWKTAEPTDFYTNYDEALSNISFETQVSNYAESNFHEDTYGAILYDLMSVQVPQEFSERSFDVPVPEIAQLALINTTWQPQKEEYDEDDSDDEWEDEEELEEDRGDDAEDG